MTQAFPPDSIGVQNGPGIRSRNTGSVKTAILPISLSPPLIIAFTIPGYVGHGFRWFLRFLGSRQLSVPRAAGEGWSGPGPCGTRPVIRVGWANQEAPLGSGWAEMPGKLVAPSWLTVLVLVTSFCCAWSGNGGCSIVMCKVHTLLVTRAH